MGLLATVLRASTPGPIDDFWYTPYSGWPNTHAGTSITPETALTISTVFACVRVISETVASLPFLLYRPMADGGKERAPDHWAYRLLHDSPNPWQTSFEFREMMTGHCALRGTAYAEIAWNDSQTKALSLTPIHPDRVTVDLVKPETIVSYPAAPARAVGQRVRYKVRQNNAAERVLLQEQVFRLVGPSGNGITGYSIVSLARESFGLAKATETFGARFFGSGSHPSGAMKHPKTLSPVAIERLKADFIAKTSGLGNSHQPLFFEEGMEWQQIGLSNEDSQFLETRQFQKDDVPGWFRMPPHKVGILNHATFTNIEHQAIEFVTDTMRPWLVRWEQSVHRDLLYDEPGDVFAELLVEGLLRGDTPTRYASYAVARQWGWMSVNEIRVRENMNKIAGGDAYITEPQNITGRPGGTPPTAALRGIVLETAGRLVRREEAAVVKAATRLAGDSGAFAAWCEEFYGQFEGLLVEQLKLSPAAAARYCARHREELASGLGALADWVHCDEELAGLVPGTEEE